MTIIIIRIIRIIIIIVTWKGKQTSCSRLERSVFSRLERMYSKEELSE